MFFYEGQSCPVCGKPFTESDDIVSCPACGAPHHRACWLEEGHCHFADKHGTLEQWTRPEPTESEPESTPSEQPAAEGETARCPHCGKENPTFAEFCSRCGRPLKAREWSAPQGPSSYTPYHAPMGDDYSVPRQTPLDEEGTTAGEAALAVAVNQRYYLPRFRKMHDNGALVSWNWVAFFFPSPWLFFRKSYLFGALILLLDLAFTTVTNLVTLEQMLIYNNALDLATTPAEIAQAAMQFANNIPPAATMLSFLWMALHVFCGLFGNYLYRTSVLHRCRRLKRNFPSDYEARLPIEGGITVALFALAFFVVEFFPQILCNLLLYFHM